MNSRTVRFEDIPDGYILTDDPDPDAAHPASAPLDVTTAAPSAQADGEADDLPDYLGGSPGMRYLVALLVGFVLGARAMRRAIEQQQVAPMPDDIDWLSEFLLTHQPSPAAARSN